MKRQQGVVLRVDFALRENHDFARRRRKQGASGPKRFSVRRAAHHRIRPKPLNDSAPQPAHAVKGFTAGQIMEGRVSRLRQREQQGRVYIGRVIRGEQQAFPAQRSKPRRVRCRNVYRFHMAESAQHPGQAGLPDAQRGQMQPRFAKVGSRYFCSSRR